MYGNSVDNLILGKKSYTMLSIFACQVLLWLCFWIGIRRTMENNEKINVFGILPNGREDFKRFYHKCLNWNDIAWSTCVLLIRVLLKVKLSLPTNVWKFWAQLRFKFKKRPQITSSGFFRLGYWRVFFSVIWPFFRELRLPR